MSALCPTFLDSLRSIVGSERVLTDAEAGQQYGRDWTRAYTPAPGAIVLPGSIAEVQAVVKACAAKGCAIVPSGGRTGLSGGAVARNGEVVVALDRLNKLEDFNPIDRTVRCGAGVITEQLQAFAAQHDLYYPVDFASAGSSQLGGNISTNAGGIKVIRYGMTRDWVLGLTLVTGTGELLMLNNGLVKNNTGYDLRHLVIGAEGTLGIVVEATMSLAPVPAAQSVMVLGVPDMAALMPVLEAFQRKVQLSAFEFFSELALEKVVQHQGLARPFPDATPYYALIEIESADQSAIDEAMAVFEHCVEQGWVLDGVISQSETQAANLWRLREDISETISRWTPYKNDISTVVSKVPQFLADVEAVIDENYPDLEVVWFGHIGDGNVHLNILKPDTLSQDEFQQRCAIVSRWVFEAVKNHGGSVSAEHGVGLLKKDFLTYTRSESEIAIMRHIKQAFDPAGIMNPGKVFESK